MEVEFMNTMETNEVLKAIKSRRSIRVYTEEQISQKEEEAYKLGLPEGYEPLYGVAFGYSAREGKQIALKRNMDVVTYIK
jgi:nitroreductase